jgi:hypothetical protein
MSLEDAIKDADAADEVGQLCYQGIADNHGLTRSTLSRRVTTLTSRIHHLRSRFHRHQVLLHAQQAG